MALLADRKKAGKNRKKSGIKNQTFGEIRTSVSVASIFHLAHSPEKNAPYTYVVRKRDYKRRQIAPLPENALKDITVSVVLFEWQIENKRRHFREGMPGIHIGQAFVGVLDGLVGVEISR